MKAYEFVSAMFQDLLWSERPEPMTTEDAAHHLRCSAEIDHLQIPDGLTPELYSTLWNSFCLTGTLSNSYNLSDEMKGATAMTKIDAHITEDSFGSILPHSWEYAAQYLNDLIDALPEDDDGDIDRDSVIDIWERYSNGEFNDDMIQNANAEQLYTMIQDLRDERIDITPAIKDRLRELCGDGDTFALILYHWESIASYMDDDIRETVHAELAPCTEMEFLTRYLELDPDFSDLLRSEFSIRI